MPLFDESTSCAAGVADLTRDALALYDAHRQAFAEVWEAVHAERGVAAPRCTFADGEIFVATFLVFRARSERGEVPLIACCPN
jgi:hypothetical protein